MSDKKAVIEFAAKYPAAWVATLDGEEQPRVRGMAMWFADETGFYFHSGTMKSLVGQIKANRRVEIAFCNNSQDSATLKMLRVAGRVEFVEDEAMEAQLLQERPWLHAIRTRFPEEEFIIFRVVDGQARFWDMSVNGLEKEQPVIAM